jgi:iron complex transport system ATP-binding protein
MRTLKTNVVLEARKFSCQVDDKHILQEVSFQIRRGEYVSIVGPVGAGKSTLLRALDRMVIGDVSGSLEICAIPWRQWKQADLAKLATLIPSPHSPVPLVTVEQFLLMSRNPYVSPFAIIRADDRKIIHEAMVGAGVTALAQRPLDTLSSGERQKVYIATALAQGSHIWLMDEPLAFLDGRQQHEILSLIALANKEFDVTVVMATSDLNHAVLESDRILALRAGEVAFFGTPDLLMKPDVLEKVFDSAQLVVEHPTSNVPMIVPRRTAEQEKALMKLRRGVQEKSP